MFADHAETCDGVRFEVLRRRDCRCGKSLDDILFRLPGHCPHSIRLIQICQWRAFVERVAFQIG